MNISEIIEKATKHGASLAESEKKSLSKGLKKEFFSGYFFWDFSSLMNNAKTGKCTLFQEGREISFTEIDWSKPIYGITNGTLRCFVFPH